MKSATVVVRVLIYESIIYELYVEPIRHIPLTLEKFRQIFLLRIKRWEPPVRDMPRHKQEVMKLLIIATEPVKTVILKVLGPFQNFSRKGSNYKV